MVADLNGFVAFKDKDGVAVSINISHIFCIVSCAYASKPDHTEICIGAARNSIIIPMPIEAVVNEIKKQTNTGWFPST